MSSLKPDNDKNIVFSYFLFAFFAISKYDTRSMGDSNIYNVSIFPTFLKFVPYP